MLSKLDAVNQILNAIGESEISSLSSGLDDGEAALAALNRVAGEVQAKGWHVNTDPCIKLVPNKDGFIPIAPNTLRADTIVDDARLNVSVRERLPGQPALYRIKEQSFVFENSVYCHVVWNFDYEDLTPELQIYIAAKAAREYQEYEMGSVTLDSFARRREMEAWAALQDAEAESEDSNLFRANPYLVATTHRYRYRRY